MPDDEQQTPTDISNVEPAPIDQPSSEAPAQNGPLPAEPPAQPDGDELNCDSDRPHKRRKLTDSLTPQQRPSPRAVSPPWKQFSAEGPTTFLEGGKRRSGRTNALPLDLQPASGKRRTRAAGPQSSGVASHKSSSTPSKKLDLKQQPHSRSKSSSRHARTASRVSQVSAAAHTSKSRSRVKEEFSPLTPSTSTRKSIAKSQNSDKGGCSPSLAAGSGRRSSQRRSTMTNGHIKSEDGMSMNGNSGSEISPVDTDDEDEEMTDYVPDPNAKLQKLKFNVRKPTLPLPSYGNTLDFARDTRKQWTKRDFTSIDEVLDWAVDNGHQVFPGFDVYEGDDEYLKEVVEDGEQRRQHRELSRKIRAPVIRYTAEQARAEAVIRAEVDQNLQLGGKLHPDTCTQLAPDKFESGQSRQYGHWDHTVAHVINFRKLLRREQRDHRETAKRLAYAAQEKWLSIQPKSQEEIEEEREEEHRAKVTATLRQCLRDLTNKFETLRIELGKVRLAQWQQEQEALGKKALNKVMEQSAQLLDARRRLDSEMDEDANEDRSEDGGNESSDGSDTEVETGSENEEAADDEQGENMSSSGSESDDLEQPKDLDDETLTIDELKKKYGEAHVLNLDRPPDGGQKEEREMGTSQRDLSNHDGPYTQEASPNVDGGQPGSTPTELDEATQEMYDEAGEESDESIDMSEEESTDDNDDDEDDADDDEESDGSEEEDMGLLSLIATKAELEEAHEAQEDSPETLVVEDPEPEQQSEAKNKTRSIPSRLNGQYPFDDDEELEEVSLIPESSIAREASVIPDAAQVQTPAASNDEAGPDTMRTESHIERHSKLSLVTSSSPQPEPEEEAMDQDVEPAKENSLPATPVSSNGIRTPVPSLLRATLREYQHQGLDWLAGLYANGSNGILADEMGLGKTIQTISLLAHLAEVHHVWGPHLIIVPTSVMLNWEVEFKKFLPGFKVLVYYGTPEERKQKRRGWLENDKWNAVITSYNLAVGDEASFKMRRWHCMVLDEAHNIKNFKSARWQSLLGFKSTHRLLLTGTPLQNTLTELWSLMFFLMPYAEDESGRPQFAGLEEFTAWFNKPVNQIMEQGRGELTGEAKEVVQRLHTILRPYILRRLKAEVEKQMPGKYEHVVYCKLSKRQRYLYDGFMTRADTRATLSGGNHLSIIQCLLQLRKVCNHPDLFEERSITTSFAMPKSAVASYEIKDLLVRKRLLAAEDHGQLSLKAVNLLPAAIRGSVRSTNLIKKQHDGAMERLKTLIVRHHRDFTCEINFDGTGTRSTLGYMRERAHQQAAGFLDGQYKVQKMQSQAPSLMDHDHVDFIRRKLGESKILAQEMTLESPIQDLKVINRVERQYALPLPDRPGKPAQYFHWLDYCTPALRKLAPTRQDRAMAMQPYIQRFGCVTPAAVAHGIDKLTIGKPGIAVADELRPVLTRDLRIRNDPFHEPQTRLSIAFPDKRLLQYDCGKLQKLDALLRTLQAGGHRALIFTQMVRILDLLEVFLNLHGHRYLRLDGATKIEQRQIMTERFNNDPKIPVFILSSRAGGLGINLTGADTVIFYDLDWNPAMDKQCQDRCHRIGQTRDVHIYRFVSEYTIEANILRKSNQKRLLDDVIIQGGDFTTDRFKKTASVEVDEEDARHEQDEEANAAMNRILGAGPSGAISTKLLALAEDKEDIQAAAVAEREGHADDADFNEKSSGGPTRAATPRTAGARQSIAPDAAEGDEDPEYFTGVVRPRTDAGWQVFEERTCIGVDRHILEHLEWELKDVPVVPPEERNTKKRGRKGEQYKTKRRR